MAKVVGLGGVFFKAADPAKLGQWYQEWLDLPVEHPYGAILKHENLPPGGYSVWTPFPKDTTYFAPSDQTFLVNLIVDDLDGCLERVRQGGGTVMSEVEESEFGRFGWFRDPEGNKVELWQPPLETKLDEAVSTI